MNNHTLSDEVNWRLSTEMRPESEKFGLVNYIQGNKAEVIVQFTHQEEIFRSYLVCNKSTNCENALASQQLIRWVGV